MQYNRLDPDLPQSSALAFGCGSMLGRVGRRQSLRAIAQALDAGITHFDIARSYGYGEAEALLGEALKGARRDRVVIATKLGLAPPRAASWLRPLKPLARALIAATPGLRGTIRRGLAQRAPAERFSPGEARASF